VVRHDGSVARVGQIGLKIGLCRKSVAMALLRPLAAVCNKGVERRGSYDRACL
jgi:hypothetical protein